MATEAKLHASSENGGVFMWTQMIGVLPLLKSKLSGMVMWIWQCNHRIYNSPLRSLHFLWAFLVSFHFVRFYP